jgi:gliding motility-associated-like protein
LKYLITALFSLCSCFSWAQNCFQAIQDGQVVETICANKPVFFRDCSGTPNPNDVIFYYPGPDKYSSQTNLLVGEQPTEYKTTGSYIVTQIINKAGGGGTKFFEKEYAVKFAPTPTFTTISCAKNLVKVDITDSNYDDYTIDFGDGLSVKAKSKTTVQHNYTQAGTYTIKVTGSYSGSSCFSSQSKQITTLPPFKLPALQNVTVKQQAIAGEAQFEINELQPDYIYLIERWSNQQTNFQKVDTIRNITQGSITYTLKGINTTEAVWYSIRIADRCNSLISNSNSNAISSISLNTKSGNEEALLTWQSMSGAVKYEIYRNNTLITTLNSPSNTYTDKGLSCGQSYNYYIKGVGADGSTSISATQTVQVTSTAIPAAPQILASFNLKNQVELALGTPQGKTAQKFEIQKSINGANYKLLSTVQQPQFTDNLTDLSPVCYRATFTDPCNNTSQVSSASCPVILKAQKDTDSSVKLSWTSYIGFNGGIQYSVELLYGNGNVVSTYNVAGNSYTDRTLSDNLQVLQYRIKATSAITKEITYSNLEKIEQELQLYIPSAFTPNGDGLNDVLEIKGKFIDTYTLKVYNSLGNVVFHSSSHTQKWDGTYQGKMLPAGAYAYEINVKTSFGAIKRRTGTVTLLR